MRNSRNIIIITILMIITAMAVAYSTFATQLNINGQSKIIGEWNIKITGISTENISPGCDAGTPKYSNTKAIFNAKLQKPGDTITYIITIKNAGTIDAVLSSAEFTPDDESGSPAISYKITNPAYSLKAGTETTCKVQVIYNKETTKVPAIKTKKIIGVIEYVQND